MIIPHAKPSSKANHRSGSSGITSESTVRASGITYTFTAAGKPNASIVIAGFSMADLANGRLSATYGSNPDLPGQPGSGGVYLNIHGN